jgi:hypothetical protein
VPAVAGQLVERRGDDQRPGLAENSAADNSVRGVDREIIRILRLQVFGGIALKPDFMQNSSLSAMV